MSQKCKSSKGKLNGLKNSFNVYYSHIFSVVLPQTLMIDNELADYYQSFCELTIWFKKIILRADAKRYITLNDITAEFIAERNRILLYVPKTRRRLVRKKLNTIATGYYQKVARWSRKQRITIDMV